MVHKSKGTHARVRLMASMNSPVQALRRGRGVTAVLGPTNTGKTHLAIERMLGHSSGLIGLPLRLLAREVYSRAVEKVGVESVALITGEEKIKPPNPSYWISTVEAMPSDLDVAFVAVDEVRMRRSERGTSSPTACSTGAGARRRWCSVPRPCARWCSGCCRGST
jgi:hypothetical protein